MVTRYPKRSCIKFSVIESALFLLKRFENEARRLTVSYKEKTIVERTFHLSQRLVNLLLILVVTACNSGGSGSTPVEPPPPVNTPPTASAGVDQSVTEGDTVQLQGSGSDAQGSVTISWTQTGGSVVSLSSTNVASPSFTAPQVTSAITIEFTLTVTDSDGVAVTDSVFVTVTDTTTASFSVGGTITGNSGAVTLSLNGVEETFSGPAFTFVQTLDDGEAYAIQFVSTTSDQFCIIDNNGGIIAANVNNVVVTCTARVAVLRFDDAEVTGHLATGDFNNDGFVDLVFSIRTLMGHPSGQNIDLFQLTYGNGTGAFTGTTEINRLGSSDSDQRGHHLIAGDFNGDTIADFAFAGGNVLEAFAGDSAENHPAIYRVSNVNRVVGAPLYAIDTDGDADLDLITIDFALRLTNNGIGPFDNSQLIASALISPINLIPGDFDGDGIADILVIGQESISDLALGLYLGNTAGAFDPPTSLTSLSADLFLGGFVFDNVSKELGAGDFDKDGDLDIVITSTTDFLQIMVNDGFGQFTAGQRVQIGSEPIHVRVGDFDNDGLLDLASINQTSKDIVISLGNGDNTFADNTGNDVRSIVIQLDPDVDLRDMNVIDIDGDGFLDILLAEDGTNPPNTGRGSIQLALAPGQ